MSIQTQFKILKLSSQATFDTINRKFEKPIAVQVKAINIQMLNRLPKTRDKSDSFYRRLIIVPFSYSFTNNGERPYIKHDYMYRTEVLKYVLKRALNQIHSPSLLHQTHRISHRSIYGGITTLLLNSWNEFNDRFNGIFYHRPFCMISIANGTQEHNGDKKSAFSKKIFSPTFAKLIFCVKHTWEFKANRETCIFNLCWLFYGQRRAFNYRI